MPRLSDFRITKRAVDAIRADRDATYRDADLKGFAIRTKPSGSKTYLVVYRNHEGRTRSVALGQHGELTPDQARKMAMQALGEIRGGTDLSEDRHQERKAQTVSELCEAYLAAADQGLILGKGGLPKKESTLIEDRSRINRHILPKLANRKVKDLRPADITKFMREVAKGETAVDVKTKARGRARVTGGLGVASRTVGLLGGIMSFAVSEGIIQNNPCRGVKRPKDGARQVRLSEDQYAALGAALGAAEAEGEAWQGLTVIRLLALTGCRLDEIAGLRWSEVDLEGKAMRLEDTKTRRSIRPLGYPALRLLADLPRNGDYVFPAIRKANGPYTSVPKAWQRVVALAESGGTNPLDGITLHGLRHAFASVADDLGLTEITIAAIIGHSKAGTTSRYVHKLDSALIAAADRVAVRIEAQMTGTNEGATVVPLRQA